MFTLALISCVVAFIGVPAMQLIQAKKEKEELPIALPTINHQSNALTQEQINENLEEIQRQEQYNQSQEGTLLEIYQEQDSNIVVLPQSKTNATFSQTVNHLSNQIQQDHSLPNLQNHSQDHSQPNPQDHSQPNPQDHSQPNPQDHSQPNPQSNPQGYRSVQSIAQKASVVPTKKIANIHSLTTDQELAQIRYNIDLPKNPNTQAFTDHLKFKEQFESITPQKQNKLQAKLNQEHANHPLGHWRSEGQRYEIPMHLDIHFSMRDFYLHFEDFFSIHTLIHMDKMNELLKKQRANKKILAIDPINLDQFNPEYAEELLQKAEHQELTKEEKKYAKQYQHILASAPSSIPYRFQRTTVTQPDLERELAEQIAQSKEVAPNTQAPKLSRAQIIEQRKKELEQEREAFIKSLPPGKKPAR